MRRRRKVSSHTHSCTHTHIHAWRKEMEERICLSVGLRRGHQYLHLVVAVVVAAAAVAADHRQ